MHPTIIILLIILIIFLVQIKIIWLAYGIGLLFVGYFLSDFLLNFLKMLGFLKKGAVNTANSELGEMENADPKSPSGKEFFEKGFSRIGKSLGESEKAKMENKKIVEKRGTFQMLGDSADDFISGILKLFK